MRKVLAVLLVVVALVGTLGVAYALAQPPSKDALAKGVESMRVYSFTRKTEFNQYRVYAMDNGTVRKEFAYHGRSITTGKVDLNRGIVSIHDEIYINGSLALRGDATFNLVTGDVSGTVVLPDGSTMDINRFFERYYGIDRGKSIEMLRNTLPTLALSGVIQQSSNLHQVNRHLSVWDRIMMGLGLREKVFEYSFTTKSGREWHMFVDSRGRPVKFEMKNDDVNIVISISPEE